jgi:hypothetical protein
MNEGEGATWPFALPICANHVAVQSCVEAGPDVVGPCYEVP